MYIYGPSHLHGSAQLQGIQHVRNARVEASDTSAVQRSQTPCDEVQLSENAQAAAEAARLTEVAKSLPDVRMDLVMRVRSEIARGTYETPDKLDVAVGRLFDEMG